MSNKYWEKREAEALKHYLKQEEDYKKHLDGIYDRTLDNIQKEINAFYGRYAKKEGITLAEAKKRVKTADIKEFERKAKQYVKDKNFSKQANEEMRLYNLMMKVNRLEMLKANIGLELISSFDEMDKFMEAILDGRTREELERQAGILGKTIQGNHRLADHIVHASFHNATYSDRIWMYQDLLRDEIGKQLERGLIQGKNPRVLARELNKVFNTGKYNCERLMRTELARVQIEAQRESYEAYDIEMFTFISNTGCCDKCDAIAGKQFYVKNMIPGENAPPMHPNCRCSTAPYSDRKEFDEWLEHLANGGTKRKIDFINREKALRTKETAFSVNWHIVKSKEYTEKFSFLSNDRKVVELAAQRARNILRHRDGVETEEIYAINLSTGKDVAKIINQNYIRGVKRTDKFTRSLLRTEQRGEMILTLHNHPNSTPPSIADLNELWNNENVSGLVVCHDGTLYYYTRPKSKINKFDYTVALRKVKSYNVYEKDEKRLMELTIKELSKRKEFTFKVIK